MARGVNKVILVGNLGRDPEVRYTGNGAAVASFSVATSESWTDKQTGEKQERTEWHNVSMFGKLAEIAGEYLKKGRQVYIEGSLRTEKYTGQDGMERYSTKVIANEMQMLGGMGGESGMGGAGAPRERTQPAPRTAGGYDAVQGGAQSGHGSARSVQHPPAAMSQPAEAPSFDDDEIPF